MTRKLEDTAEGCRALAVADQARAADVETGHMRAVLERSATAWATRARLLERLEANFVAKADACALKARRPGQRTQHG